MKKQEEQKPNQTVININKATEESFGLFRNTSPLRVRSSLIYKDYGVSGGRSALPYDFNATSKYYD